MPFTTECRFFPCRNRRVGIGAAGAVALGMVLLGEPATPARLFFLAQLAVAIVGLKLTSH